MKVEWDAHELADRMSSKGQHVPLYCLVDMVDQLSDSPRECVLVNVSFMAIFVGDDEKLFFSCACPQFWPGRPQWIMAPITLLRNPTNWSCNPGVEQNRTGQGTLLILTRYNNPDLCTVSTHLHRKDQAAQGAGHYRPLHYLYTPSWQGICNHPQDVASGLSSQGRHPGHSRLNKSDSFRTSSPGGMVQNMHSLQALFMDCPAWGPTETGP